MTAKRRRSMRLLSHERQLFRHVYAQLNIPVDQYAKCYEDLIRFRDLWNRLSERNDSCENVYHCMLTRRKAGGWVTLGGNHRRMSELADDTLRDDQWDELLSLYIELFGPDEIGSDHLAYNPELACQLARSFGSRTGKFMTGAKLYALIMARRKAGKWVRVRTGSTPPSIGFGDLDQVAV